MYKRFLDILDLVYELQSSVDGIGYSEIMEKYGGSRRTAERMLAAVRDFYPEDVEYISQRPLRIRLNRTLPTPKLSLEDFTAMQTAQQMFKESGMRSYSAQMDKLIRSLKANMLPRDLASIEVDADALGESEAFVFRPGPKENIEKDVIARLRHAILACLAVKFRYCKVYSLETEEVTLYPYGFLHGSRQYLVGYNPERNDYRNYILSRVTDMELLSGEYFERDPEFTFGDYLRECFGSFREKPRKVVWRFDASQRDNVLEWVFHPSQTTRVMRDGRVEVTFYAGGIEEMAHFVLNWRGKIEVMHPRKLITKLAEIKKNFA